MIPNKKKSYSRYAEAMLCPITPRGSFHIGLIPFFIKRYNKVRFSISEILLKKLKPCGISDIVDPKNEKFKYRDYQLEAITNALSVGRGVIILPTSAGKSLVIYGIIESMLASRPELSPILLLTPNIQLVSQLNGDLIEYGMDPDWIAMFSSFSSEDLAGKKVIISNRQWLERHKKELPEIKAVVVDECHSLRKGNEVAKFINDLHTDVRIGLTGTLPVGEEDVWNIYGILGDTLIKKEIKTLQDDKWIAAIDIVGVVVRPDCPPPSIFDDLPEGAVVDPKDIIKDYNMEVAHVEMQDKPKKVISSMVEKLHKNTLVLFDHTEYGKSLFRSMPTTKESFFINGEVDLSLREIATDRMEKADNIVIVANAACFGTGINIKNIHNIIMTVNGAAPTKILQAIGRGLRLKENKHKLLLIDVSHDTKYSKKQAEHRRNLYKKEYGMNINYKVV
jgi:superfamily II DNA or RNA helicase